MTRLLLIVDDRMTDRLLISRAANQLVKDLQVLELCDGREFVDYMNAPSSQCPDVIMLDINMCRLTGHDALEQLKGHQMLKSSMLVVMSDSRQEKDVNLSYALGCDVFITKPTSISLKSPIDAWYRTASTPRRYS